MRKLFIVLLILSLATPVAAQNNTTRFFNAYDYENLTVDSTAGGVGFSTSKLSGTKAQAVTVTISCASGTSCNARFTVDGTAPTTTVGLLVSYGQSFVIYGSSNLRRFKAIREGATSAVFNVQYSE